MLHLVGFFLYELHYDTRIHEHQGCSTRTPAIPAEAVEAVEKTRLFDIFDRKVSGIPSQRHVVIVAYGEANESPASQDIPRHIM